MPQRRRSEMRKLKALDLFCGAGGASIGLYQAGFDVIVGIDNNRNCGKRYPFDFILADALSPPLHLMGFRLHLGITALRGIQPPQATRARKKGSRIHRFTHSRRAVMIASHPCYGASRTSRTHRCERMWFCNRVPPSDWKISSGFG